MPERQPVGRGINTCTKCKGWVLVLSPAFSDRMHVRVAQGIATFSQKSSLQLRSPVFKKFAPAFRETELHKPLSGLRCVIRPTRSVLNGTRPQFYTIGGSLLALARRYMQLVHACVSSWQRSCANFEALGRLVRLRQSQGSAGLVKSRTGTSVCVCVYV